MTSRSSFASRNYTQFLAIGFVLALKSKNKKSCITLEFFEYIFHRIHVSFFVPIVSIPTKENSVVDQRLEEIARLVVLDTVIGIFRGIGRRRGRCQPLSRRDANSLFLSRNPGHAAATVSCFRCYRLLRTCVPCIREKRCHDIERKSLFHFFNSLLIWKTSLSFHSALINAISSINISLS